MIKKIAFVKNNIYTIMNKFSKIVENFVSKKQNSKVIIKISDLAVHYLNGSCWMPTSQTTLEEKNQFLFETIKSMGMEI